ncbi:hypothetical protein E4U13_003417 [Claviceps humidiphila]|uniref:Uncharacterized protein n=1 Tax=Claviceps humidiphila TaxID=1294629 RepID=A0A9P7PYE8_9HYPO|nr:hypothetical protein E4U13_003417 [Claviceps humidiphila]
MPLNGNLKASSIYLTLNARRRPETYHWGLILTDPDMNAAFHHANNLYGSWKYEEKVAKPDQSTTLTVLVLVGRTKNHPRIMEVIRGIPADGSPSKRTGESFTCRIWVKDVLVSLHECGEIVLPGTIDELENMALEQGLRYRRVAGDSGGATVINETSSQGATAIENPSDQGAAAIENPSGQGATDLRS